MTNLALELTLFTGTEAYYYLPYFKKFNYTDGIKYLAEQAGAYWLIEQIFLAQQEKEIQEYRAKGEDFQGWKLILQPAHAPKIEIVHVTKDQSQTLCNSAVLVCEDGNNNEIYRVYIPFTDFPLDHIELWLEGNVLLLPSEH